MGVLAAIWRPACSRRRQIDQVCRLPVTLRSDLEFVAGRGIAATMGGSKVAPGSKPRGHQQAVGQSGRFCTNLTGSPNPDVSR